MNTDLRASLRATGVAIRAMLLATLVLGVAYTALITGIGQVALAGPANGSLVTGPDQAVIGSSLIGQSFADADGDPLPGWFQSRPSAAGEGYDARASSGSNLGPENPDLIRLIRERREQVAAFNGVGVDEVPADAVTASGSGLDPHISPEYARLQAPRVARARGLDLEAVRRLVETHVVGRGLGYVGEPHVNVLELNLALDGMEA